MSVMSACHQLLVSGNANVAFPVLAIRSEDLLPKLVVEVFANMTHVEADSIEQFGFCPTERVKLTFEDGRDI